MQNTNDKPKTLADAIAAACASSEPFTKSRKKALASVRWALRSSTGGYIALGVSAFDPPVIVPTIAEATVYDGRDNEEMKLGFFQAITGLTLSVELVEAL